MGNVLAFKRKISITTISQCYACNYTGWEIQNPLFCIDCHDDGIAGFHAFSENLLKAMREYEEYQPWYNKRWFVNILNSVFPE